MQKAYVSKFVVRDEGTVVAGEEVDDIFIQSCCRHASTNHSDVMIKLLRRVTDSPPH